MKICQVQRRGDDQMDQIDNVTDIRYELGWLHIEHDPSDCGGEIWTTSYPTSFIGEVRVIEDDDDV